MIKYLGMVVGMMTGVTLTLVASPAAARTNVDINIGVPAPVYVQPAPVYVQPRPVYVQPQPVYLRAQPVYVERHHHHHHGWHDRDGDGVPNRWDRRPNDPYRY